MKNLDVPTIAATAIVSLLTGYFIGKSVVSKETHEQVKESLSEDNNEEEEEELDPLPEAKIDARNYDNFKLTLVVRSDLGMTKGKIAAQCGHATLACYKAVKIVNPEILKAWEYSGQAKVALKCDSEDKLLELQAIALSLGLPAQTIQDAGRTQIAAGSRTVLGVGPAQMEAFITLVATDAYAPGALIIAHRLRELGSKKDKVCLVTPNVSGHVQTLLSKLYVVIPVNTLRSNDYGNLELLGRPDLDITFTKIHLWSLTQYSKIVFLDADTLPLQNIDSLFDRPSFSAAPDAGWPDCFNSGVFVAKPSKKIHSDLLQLAAKEGSFDGGDQGLLNTYFSSWPKTPFHRLPFTFNTTPTAQYGYAPAQIQYGNNIHIAHFIGQNKPWKYQRFADGKVLPMGDAWEGTSKMVQTCGFQTSPIIPFTSEAIKNAWANEEYNINDSRRQINPMPPLSTITLTQPDWLQQELKSISEQNYYQDHDDHQRKVYHLQQEEPYTMIHWDPAHEDPPNVGCLGADIPDLSSYRNVWDQSIDDQQQHVWVAPVLQPEPDIMMKPEYAQFRQETKIKDCNQEEVHEDTNIHHSIQEKKKILLFEAQSNHHSFPWESNPQHFPVPTRIWQDEYRETTHFENEIRKENNQIDKQEQSVTCDKISDRNVHIVSEESHCSEKQEEHSEWTEQAETNHLDVHLEQEKSINTEVQVANEFAIDETLSPSVQSRIEDFIADLHKEDDEDDTSERDLIPINFKPSSRLQSYTISPHGSCSTSRVSSRSGSRRSSVASSRRSSLSGKRLLNDLPSLVPTPRPSKLFATDSSSSVFSRKTPYTSAAVTPELEKMNYFHEYNDDDFKVEKANEDFLPSASYYLNESLELAHTETWNPMDALTKLKLQSENMVLRQSLTEALNRAVAQETEKQDMMHEYKSVWEDEPSFISGQSSPRTPIIRGMPSNLSNEIELEKERYRQQRESLSMTQPQTAIASLLEAELDLSRGTLFQRRYEETPTKAQEVPLVHIKEEEEALHTTYFNNDVIKEAQKRLNALVVNNDNDRDNNGDKLWSISEMNITGKLVQKPSHLYQQTKASGSSNFYSSSNTSNFDVCQSLKTYQSPVQSEAPSTLNPLSILEMKEVDLFKSTGDLCQAQHQKNEPLEMGEHKAVKPKEDDIPGFGHLKDKASFEKKVVSHVEQFEQSLDKGFAKDKISASSDEEWETIQRANLAKKDHEEHLIDKRMPILNEDKVAILKEALEDEKEYLINTTSKEFFEKAVDSMRAGKFKGEMVDKEKNITHLICKKHTGQENIKKSEFLIAADAAAVTTPSEPSVIERNDVTEPSAREEIVSISDEDMFTVQVKSEVIEKETSTKEEDEIIGFITKEKRRRRPTMEEFVFIDEESIAEDAMEAEVFDTNMIETPQEKKEFMALEYEEQFYASQVHDLQSYKEQVAQERATEKGETNQDNELRTEKYQGFAKEKQVEESEKKITEIIERIVGSSSTAVKKSHEAQIEQSDVDVLFVNNQKEQAGEQLRELAIEILDEAKGRRSRDKGKQKEVNDKLKMIKHQIHKQPVYKEQLHLKNYDSAIYDSRSVGRYTVETLEVDSDLQELIQHIEKLQEVIEVESLEAESEVQRRVVQTMEIEEDVLEAETMNDEVYLEVIEIEGDGSEVETMDSGATEEVMEIEESFKIEPMSREISLDIIEIEEEVSDTDTVRPDEVSMEFMEIEDEISPIEAITREISLDIIEVEDVASDDVMTSSKSAEQVTATGVLQTETLSRETSLDIIDYYDDVFRTESMSRDASFDLVEALDKDSKVETSSCEIFQETTETKDETLQTELMSREFSLDIIEVEDIGSEIETKNFEHVPEILEIENNDVNIETVSYEVDMEIIEIEEPSEKISESTTAEINKDIYGTKGSIPVAATEFSKSRPVMPLPVRSISESLLSTSKRAVASAETTPVVVEAFGGRRDFPESEEDIVLRVRTLGSNASRSIIASVETTPSSSRSISTNVPSKKSNHLSLISDWLKITSPTNGVPGICTISYDFSKELDVSVLDQIVLTFYTGSGLDQQVAQQLLTQFQDHDDAWTQVDCILEQSKLPQTKILEKFVQTRWNTLPSDNRNAIRYFIVNVIIKISSDEANFNKERTYINKLNMVLVQILKQDWPRHWPSFIPEIVSSSKTNLTLCENNMTILKLLSEEIFDYSAEQMIHLKTSNLRQSICDEFSEIFYLCVEILEKATKTSLVKVTLDTLLRFLSWIPVGYIFETDLIQLLGKFFQTPHHRNIALKCLTEIGSLPVNAEHTEKVIALFSQVMSSVNIIMPLDTDIASLYENSNDDDQEFVQDLSLFLTSFLETHVQTIEQNQELNELLINAHRYMINISNVEDREIFKICLEYWSKLVRSLYEEAYQNYGERPRMRKNMYVDILSSLRVVMIERMVKPEEVLIVEDEEGEIVREFVKESDTIVLYKSMKEVLVYLTNLDVTDTEKIMTVKLSRQVDGSEWSWQNLNKLCWAVGSISGAMNTDTEKIFLVFVIKELLELCEKKNGKNNKAVVASNIMYCVGQYPRFLKSHWRFLKTVINKLFEFMHESHEGVQDMACDTFIKISGECKRCFVTQQVGEVCPFVEEIIDQIQSITSDLSAQQTHTFYKAVGFMISAQTNKSIQESLINKLMRVPNMAWNDVVMFLSNDTSILHDDQRVKVLSNVLKTNISVCSSVGPGFINQLNLIYVDLLTLYRAVGTIINQLVVEQGQIAIKTPKVRALKSIKKDILKLIDTYIECAANIDYVNKHMIIPFLATTLHDYNSNIDIVRESYVLEVITTLIGKLNALLIPHIPDILQATFEPTLSMITKDFTEYPEHREGFYHMLRAINRHCFPALLELEPPQFKLFIDSVVWGFKHTLRNIADIGLNTCEELIKNMSSTDPNIAGAFYQSYYLSILQDIFFVLTDRDHKSGFKGQTEILALLFNLVKNNTISVALYDPSQVTDADINNTKFLEKYVLTLLLNAFPHLQRGQIVVFVHAMFEYNNNLPKFKLEVRDFLIQLKEFAGENTELYLEEKEAEMEAKRKEEKEKALRIPGMVKPSELPSMDEDEAL
ncbi:hypothetical protein G6F43_003887 [Rhizopus delemar]|nr:hypothetical protein G6F43_003887 [Rhizopus delemar]